MRLAAVWLFATHLVIPGWFVASLWFRPSPSKLAWLADTLGYGAYLAHMVLAGAGWDWVSYYARVALPAAYLAAVYESCRRVWAAGAPWWRAPASPGEGVGLAASVLLALFFTRRSLTAAQGLSHGDAPAAELSFPLKGGVYFVGQGGSNSILNIHYVDRAQRFGVDIVKLNAAGTRARGIYPDDPTRYAAFGDAVYSPCAGTVVAAEDGLPDNRPPALDRAHLAGNHVVIRCEAQGVDVMLAHLMQGSVAVKPGERVEAGRLVGRVGNSGHTTEPHLHIHAVRTGSGSALDGEGVPVRFDGRFPVRNRLFIRWCASRDSNPEPAD